MSDGANKPALAWFSAMRDHEGQPLALRVRPAADSAANRDSFPRLAILSQELACVKSNGLPENGYNNSLRGFDQDVHLFTERDREGLIVLVETFSGRRAYYAYVADVARLTSRITELRIKYPQHVIHLRFGMDSQWQFYNEYRHIFPW